MPPAEAVESVGALFRDQDREGVSRLKGSARREIVGALEELAWRPESFDQASKLLLRLAGVPIPTTMPNTGSGGTYVYTAPNETALGHAASVRSSHGASVTSPVALPRTGGAGADKGNLPSSPIAPLALLGMIAVGAGRLTWNRIKRLS
jgi:hypothetical protein